jgi:hypothetical protein
MDEALNAFLSELWMILRESGVWLIFGFLLAGLVHAFVPRAWMLKQLGGKGVGPIAKASLLGIPMPLCSCAVIPVAAGLRRSGATKGASAAFAISTPQTGEESVPLTWGLFGPVYALTRPVVAVVTAFIAGVLITTFTDETTHPNAKKKGSEDGESSCCSHSSDGHDHSDHAPMGDVSLNVLGNPKDKPRWARKLNTALSHGFGTMLIDLAGWLALGLILAAVIGAAVPEGWVSEHVGTGIVPKLAMLVVGIPVYICATSSTPLAFSLVAAGLSPGAALVLLLSGPATNVATMSWLIKDLGVKSLVIYLLTIAACALGAGIAFDAFLSGTIQLADTGAAHDHGGAGAWGVVKDVCAVALVVLMGWALGMKTRGFAKERGWFGHGSASGSCCSTGASAQGSSTSGSCCGGSGGS